MKNQEEIFIIMWGIVFLCLGIFLFGLFVSNLGKKKNANKITVFDKYEINSDEDAYRLLDNSNVSERHKKEIKALIKFKNRLNE